MTTRDEAQGQGQKDKKEKDQIQVIKRARLFHNDDMVQQNYAEELGYRIFVAKDEEHPQIVTTDIPEWTRQIEQDLRNDLK